MERRDRKRKAQEISESPQSVSETIHELTSVLAESDAILRAEISELRDEVGKLEKHLSDKAEECNRLQSIVDFFHPDAIMDRIHLKLYIHGDHSMLRRAIDPQSRALRSTDARGDRYLFLSETPAKKKSKTAKANEFSPKHEDEKDVTSMIPATEPVAATNADDAEEKQQDDEDTQDEDSAPATFDLQAQSATASQKEITTDTMMEPAAEIDGMNPDGVPGVMSS
ncbi:hypothetical protein F442_03650 [Phytophthora nicotianae P10297]|uniref:Uncharacterized protein n=1 Tax=Phytophthora nicotianae P10297 TaxID=1317064 RepID=W2ZV06_PHYNI|nr:hypothetical protein F442_03650 [Phytophthora nicotianae P10297]